MCPVQMNSVFLFILLSREKRVNVRFEFSFQDVFMSRMNWVEVALYMKQFAI